MQFNKKNNQSKRARKEEREGERERDGFKAGARAQANFRDKERPTIYRYRSLFSDWVESWVMDAHFSISEN